MIPEVHLAEYQAARGLADDLAQQGKLAAGYTELLEHWETAMSMQQQGIPWALSLAILYLTAMDDFCDRYGPSPTLPAELDVPPPAEPQQRLRRRLPGHESATLRGAAPKRPKDGAYWAAWLRTRRGRMP